MRGPVGRAAAGSLRKPLLKAIHAAGLTPWRKLWTALRATRDTELTEEFPSHRVCGWLGHSEKVANESYRQTPDAAYSDAVRKMAQKVAQQAAAATCSDLQRKTATPSFPRGLPLTAAYCAAMPSYQIGLEGLENTANSSEKPAQSSASGAQSGALSEMPIWIDTDLLLVITIWPSLTLETKRTILAVVRSQPQ